MPHRISFRPDLRFNSIRVTRSWVMDSPAVYAAFFYGEERLVLCFGIQSLGLMDLDGVSWDSWIWMGFFLLGDFGKPEELLGTGRDSHKPVFPRSRIELFRESIVNSIVQG